MRLIATWQVAVVIEKIESLNKMQPVIIQHIMKKLKRVIPSKIAEADTKDHSTLGTTFVLVLALVILIVAFN